MRSVFHVLLVLTVSGMVFATEQQPDILRYDGLELALRTGWGHPSPLQTYYHQNKLASPFVAHSTANYRGHVAVWEIVNDKLYLTDIQIEDTEPNEARPRGFDYIVRSHEPNEYGVQARCCPTPASGDVVADWFSGVLDCYARRDDGSYASYLFHVRDANVVDRSEDLTNKHRMLALRDNYVTYYYRLDEDDAIEFKGQDCRLATGFDRLSPIFGLYDDDHLKWPYNWENTEKCGAPHCQWLVEDGKLYLTGMELHSGLGLFTIETEPVDVATLFPDRVADGVVFANWVSGVYLIEHGHATEEDAGWPGGTFTVFHATELTYVRMEDGRLTESHTVPVHFDMENASEGLKQIVEDYRLPNVPDVPSP